MRGIGPVKPRLKKLVRRFCCGARNSMNSLKKNYENVCSKFQRKATDFSFTIILGSCFGEILSKKLLNL